jgi:bacterioferritin (cytochrome b1)
VTATQRQVNIADRMWARLLSSTNQPNFLRYNKYMQQLRKQNALKQALESEQHVTVANSNSVPSSPSSSTVSTHQLFPQSFFQHEDKWSKTEMAIPGH